MRTDRSGLRRGLCVTLWLVALVTPHAPAASARAQTRWDGDQTNDGASERLVRSAGYHGYWDGFSRAAEDRKIGPDFRSRVDESYLRADIGYTADIGGLEDYRRAYRQAYDRGYTDGCSSHDLAVAATVAAPPPDPGDEPGEDRAGRAELDRTSLGVASASGYEAGFTQGVEDRGRGASYGYRANEIYRAADDGYDTSLGDEETYRDVFRQIYARGYSDGFNGRKRYTAVSSDPGRPEETQIDLDADRRNHGTAPGDGYREGYALGRDDCRSGVLRLDPFGHAPYRSALGGLVRADGERSADEREYRRAYELGYGDGFAGRDSSFVASP